MSYIEGRPTPLNDCRTGYLEGYQQAIREAQNLISSQRLHILDLDAQKIVDLIYEKLAEIKKNKLSEMYPGSRMPAVIQKLSPGGGDEAFKSE
jgi:hypothetical protein